MIQDFYLLIALLFSKHLLVRVHEHLLEHFKVPFRATQLYIKPVPESVERRNIRRCSSDQHP